MEQLSDPKKLRPWMGFVAQAAFLGLFLTAGAYMQRNWGTMGLLSSELMFLLVSVLYCLLRKVKLKEMFPVKKITGSDFLGVVFLGVAGFLFSLLALGVSLAVLPRSFRSEVEGLSNVIYGSMNYPVLVLVVAVIPAICEEAMERGCVLSHLRPIKKDWLIVLIMGLFFGIMHMSPLRFLNTAVLGAILSYLMVKKNNILLPMLLHFMNNFVSVTFGALGNQAVDTTRATKQIMDLDGVTFLGSYMVLGCCAPLVLVLAMMFLDPKNHKAYRFAIAGGITFALFAAGSGLVVMSAMHFPI